MGVKQDCDWQSLESVDTSVQFKMLHIYMCALESQALSEVSAKFAFETVSLWTTHSLLILIQFHPVISIQLLIPSDKYTTQQICFKVVYLMWSLAK